MCKNTIILGLVTIFLVLWFPSGEPFDLLIIPMIHQMGMAAYISYSVVVVVLAYLLIDGNGIKGKLKTIKDELKYIFGG